MRYTCSELCDDRRSDTVTLRTWFGALEQGVRWRMRATGRAPILGVQTKPERIETPVNLVLKSHLDLDHETLHRCVTERAGCPLQYLAFGSVDIDLDVGGSWQAESLYEVVQRHGEQGAALFRRFSSASL